MHRRVVPSLENTVRWVRGEEAETQALSRTAIHHQTTQIIIFHQNTDLDPRRSKSFISHCENASENGRRSESKEMLKMERRARSRYILTHRKLTLRGPSILMALASIESEMQLQVSSMRLVVADSSVDPESGDGVVYPESQKLARSSAHLNASAHQAVRVILPSQFSRFLSLLFLNHTCSFFCFDFLTQS